MDEEALLQRIPLFASLPVDEACSLLRSMRPVNLEAGATLFKEGEPGNSFYIIIEGSLEVIKALGLPAEHLLNLRGPGEFIGEMSLFGPSGTRSATIRASTDVTLLEMSHREFLDVLQSNPGIGLSMLHELSQRLNRTDEELIHGLQEKNAQLAQAYQELQAAQAQLIEKEKLERELQVAWSIQQSTLPRHLPHLDGFEFSARLLPARSVGGDLFDFIPLDRNRLGLLIGDVSDKGVPAAIFMALTRSLLRAEAKQNTPPARVLQRVNTLLLDMNQSGMFITVLYGILDRASRQFTYARAGHESPLMLLPSGGMVQAPRGPGQPLGLFNHPTIDQQSLSFPIGALLMLFTDGVNETMNPQMDMFGLEGLLRVARSAIQEPAQAVSDRVFKSLLAFQSGAPQHDDITLVLARAFP